MDFFPLSQSSSCESLDEGHVCFLSKFWSIRHTSNVLIKSEQTTWLGLQIDLSFVTSLLPLLLHTLWEIIQFLIVGKLSFEGDTHPAAQRASSWLEAQGISLVHEGELYEVTGIEPGLVLYKSTTLPSLDYLSVPKGGRFFFLNKTLYLLVD